MARKKIDLRALPGWLQYIIVLTTVAVVALIAWYFGRDTPAPPWLAWFTRHLTLLGWVYIAALVVLVVRWLVRKRSNKN